MPHRGALSTKVLGVEDVAFGPGRSRCGVPASGGKRERAASDRSITQSAAALGNLLAISTRSSYALLAFSRSSA
jgi:hypothetical protein